MSKKEGYILVGMGDRSIAELVDGVKGDPEFISEVLESIVHDVPRYKSFTGSSQAEQTAFVEYLQILKQFINKEEEQDG